MFRFYHTSSIIGYIYVLTTWNTPLSPGRGKYVTSNSLVIRLENTGSRCVLCLFLILKNIDESNNHIMFDSLKTCNIVNDI